MFYLLHLPKNMGMFITRICVSLKNQLIARFYRTIDSLSITYILLHIIIKFATLTEKEGYIHYENMCEFEVSIV